MIEQSQIQEGATILIGGGWYGKLTGRMKFNHGIRKQTLAQVLTRHTKPNHRGVYNEIGHWVPLNQLTLSEEDFEALWKAKTQDEEHKGDKILTEEAMKAIRESKS